MKTQILISALSIAVTTLVGCNDTQKKQLDGNGELISCDFKSVDNTIADIPLSDLIEDCQLIRFDNSEAALFKAWTITATDHYIGIRQSGAPFKLFDRQGKFLCDVGAVGNGPGEYSISIYDEIIDEKGGRIYFTGFVGDKIMIYDLNGKWIKDIKLPLKVNKPKISLNSDGTLSVVHMAFDEGVPFAFCVDTEGNIIKQIPTPAHIKVSNFDGEIFSYQNGAVFDFFHTSNDTLFAYNATENRLEPHFVMTFPDPKNTPIHIYMELPKHYFVHWYYWDTQKGQPGEEGTFMVDKETKKATRFSLVNDFFGNLSIRSNFNKGYYLQNIEPSTLKEIIEKHIASGKCPGNDKKKLEELAASLNENDNNLLFIGKLKQSRATAPTYVSTK